MKVLRIHNYYQQAGGESAVHDAECALLERAGCEVIRYERHNNEIAELGILGRAVVAADTVWSGRTWREVRAQIERERPDVAHLTNTFPLISPSASVTSFTPAKTRCLNRPAMCSWSRDSRSRASASTTSKCPAEASRSSR